MTQIFTADGTVVPVTVVQAGPCLVVQKKTADKDGYDAIQIGLVDARPDRRANRAAKGRFEKAGVAPMRTLAEVGLDKDDELKPGDKVLCDAFQVEDHVDVIGVSKGKGFAGVVAPPPLQRRRRDARLDVPPRARLDRALGVSLARLSGHALLGPARADARRPRRTSSSCRWTRRRTSSTSMARSPGRATRSSRSCARASSSKASSNGKDRQSGIGRGSSVGEIDLPAEVFEYPYRRHLVWGVVKAYLAGVRRGTHKTKVRSEVSGSGKKPFKQKGTGRARQGGGRPPIHRHGGTVHGPVPRSYATGVSVGEKKNALKAVLSQRVREQRLVVARGHATSRATSTKDLQAAVGRARHRGQGALRGRRRATRISPAPRATSALEARRSARRQRLRRPEPRHRRAVEAGAVARRRDAGRLTWNRNGSSCAP